jgi:hypothetical protein
VNQMSREDVRERLGNVDQIRDIIFGSQLRDYDNRFTKVESDILLLQQEMRSHVEQIKAHFAAEMKVSFEAIEKKLKALNLNTQEESADLRQQVDRLNRKFSSSVQSLDEALDSQTHSIQEDLSQTKIQMQDDIMALRDAFMEELDRRFSQLKDAKVSKDDMAETLFALGMRLKGSELIPQLREAADDNRDYNSLPLFGTKKVSGVLAHSNGNGSAEHS